MAQHHEDEPDRNTVTNHETNSGKLKSPVSVQATDRRISCAKGHRVHGQWAVCDLVTSKLTSTPINLYNVRGLSITVGTSQPCRLIAKHLAGPGQPTFKEILIYPS